MGKFSQDVTTKSIADVNAANAAEYGAGGNAETDWRSTVAKFGYGPDYPTGGEFGLGPINSVAELQRRNAAAYGEVHQGSGATNMVGDGKHAMDCASRDGKACDCSMAKDSDESGVTGDVEPTPATRLAAGKRELAEAKKDGSSKEFVLMLEDKLRRLEREAK